MTRCDMKRMAAPLMSAYSLGADVDCDPALGPLMNIPLALRR